MGWSGVCVCEREREREGERERERAGERVRERAGGDHARALARPHIRKLATNSVIEDQRRGAAPMSAVTALARHKGRGAKTSRRPAPARKRIPGEPVDFRPFGLMRALRQHAGPAWSESCQARPRLPVARARRMVRALSGPGLGSLLRHRRWRRCAARRVSTRAGGRDGEGRYDTVYGREGVKVQADMAAALLAFCL